MTTLSGADLALSRVRPYSSELYITVFEPTTVFAASINGASGTVGLGAVDIIYDTVTTGAYTDILADTTMLVGTSAGSDDLGRIRVRSATSTYVKVAENSNIDWVNATNITVLKYWEVFPVYPRIIKNPADELDVIFYKDYDIPYVDQNTVLGAFVCAGTHKAGFAGDSLYYSSVGSEHVVIGTSMTYQWTFEGGSPSSSTSATPGYVLYNTAGDYVTTLTIAGSNTSSDTTYRYVSIRNRIGNSTKLPIRKWEMNNLAGSRGEGGYSATIKIIDEIVPSLRDGNVVMIWSDDYCGATHQSIGGNSTNNSTIFFVGHIVNGTIRYNYKTKTTEFDVGSITDIMKSAEGFAISVGDSSAPTKWYEMFNLSGKRAIYHYLKWHSTVLKINDFQFIGTDRNINYFDSDRESVFDAVDNYLRAALVGQLTADRQGKLWAEVGAWVTPNPVASFPPTQNITKQDWIGDPSIELRNVSPLSYLEAGGVAYWGTSIGVFSALLSAAPGLVPSTRGTPERIQGLALDSQSQLNELSGNLYANKVTRYPKIDMEMSGNYRQLDIAPQESVNVIIGIDDTNLGVDITAPYLVDSVSWNYDPKNKLLNPTIGTISLVDGRPGETILIPDVPPDDGFDVPDDPIDIPIDFLDFPPPPDLLDTPILGQPTTVVFGSNRGVFYTLDFDSASPVWIAMNNGLGVTRVALIRQLVTTPSGAIYILLFDEVSIFEVWRAPAVGGTFTMVANHIVPFGNVAVPYGLGVDKTSDDKIGIAAYGAGVPFVAGSFKTLTNGTTFSAGSALNMSFGFGAGSPAVIFTNNRWSVYGCKNNPFATAWVDTFTSSGGVLSSFAMIGVDRNGRFANAIGDTDEVLEWDFNTVGMNRMTNSNVTQLNLPAFNAATNRQGIAMSEDGFGMGATSNLFYFCNITTDKGTTWNQTTLIPSGSDIWEHVGGDNLRWVFGGGLFVRLTMDRGITWLEKTGNLIYIYSVLTLDITHIRVIE